MKTTSKLLIVCILSVITSHALAIDSQAGTEQKAEFRKLVLQRNQLFSKLQRLDIQAAELVKNGKAYFPSLGIYWFRNDKYTANYLKGPKDRGVIVNDRGVFI